LNICDERHEPKYQVTYKGAKRTNQNTPVWLVCEDCIGNKDCFSTGILVQRIKSVNKIGKNNRLYINE
jgi:hypothetical protein